MVNSFASIFAYQSQVAEKVINVSVGNGSGTVGPIVYLLVGDFGADIFTHFYQVPEEINEAVGYGFGQRLIFC